MIEWLSGIASSYMTGWAGFFLYWVPAALCFAGYTIRNFREYREDIQSRQKSDQGGINFYLPQLTIGRIVRRILLPFIPVANLFFLIFDVLADYLEYVDRFLSIPLVPPRSK